MAIFDRRPIGPATAASASLGRNISYAAVGNATYACCQFLTMMALVKLGSPSMVGEFALALAITAPIIIFSQCNLRSVQATDARAEYDFGDYLALRLLTSTAALLVVIGIAFLAHHSREASFVIVLVGIAKAIDSVADTFFGKWQRNERLDAASVVYAVNGVASVLTLTAALIVTHSVVWASAGFAAGSAIALVVCLVVHERYAPGAGVCPRWETTTLSRLAKLSAPLGIVMLLVSLNASTPRYFVALHDGSYELGIFAAVSYLAVVGTTLVGAAGQSLSPRLATLYAAGDLRSFVRLLRMFALACGFVGVAGVVTAASIGESVLRIVYAPEYARASSVLTISMIAAALSFVGSSLGYGLTAARQFRAQVPLFTVVVLATAGSALVLVPVSGISGAAWAGVVGAAAQVAGSLVVLRRTL